MSKIQIVVGLQFGDEGKGMVTDYLASQSPNSLVVRFSGGHQCGHTVVNSELGTPEPIRHVFSNFGSGTLRGTPTYWSKYCTVDPVGMMNELAIIKEKFKNTPLEPLLYVDRRCPVTTPYEIHDNHETERHNRHGSVGVGFGATIKREESFYSLTFGDLLYPSILKAKVKSIKENYHHMLGDVIPEREQRFFKCCQAILNCPNIVMVYEMPDPTQFRNIIFEGSQGLLLDQHYGFFPNVTRANTGLTNIDKMPNSVGFSIEDTELFLVTRAYQTRHGNGFMTNEDKPHHIALDPMETNVRNDYQGELRRSLLDTSLLRYGLSKDRFIRKAIKKNLVITCMDHVKNDYSFTHNEDIITSPDETNFIKRVSEILNIPNVYASSSSDSKYMQKLIKAPVAFAS